MIQIDFYLTHDPKPLSRLKLACRLAETAFKHRQSVYLWTPDEAVATTLDDLLWQFKQNSFVPHSLCRATVAPAVKRRTPVWIGWGDESPWPAAVLIPLSAAVPRFYGDYGRVLDPINGDAAERETARQRFRQYRDQGHAPRHHIMPDG